MAAARTVVDEATRRAFRAHNEALVLGQVSRAAFLGAPLTLGYIPAGWLAYPQLRGLVTAVAVVSMLVYLGVSRLVLLPIARRHVMATCCVVSGVVALVPGVLASATGGIASPYLIIMLVVWYVVSLLPISARQALALCATSIAVVLATLAVLAPRLEPHAVVVVNAVSALFFVMLGAHLKDRIALESFVAQRRLAEARESLSSLNDELERKVDDQVREIVQRAKEVDALNAQLRARVRERSRELSRVLRQLGEARGDRALEPGTVLGDRVEIERCIGVGGMGAVFTALDRVSGRRVAVKTMTGRPVSSDRVERFLKEAEVASAVDHPAIVKTLHVDVDESGGVYQIQELVDGRPLDAVVHERGGPSLRVATAIGAQLASALAAAHAAGVIHRDIKPNNVLVGGEPPHVHVLDFGISKLISGDADGDGDGGGDDALTKTGEVLGTPAYMAPEQFVATAHVTAAADVYALGVLLYELVTGTMPFEGSDAFRVMAAHLTSAPRDPRALRDDLPDPLAELLLACLAKEAEARPSAEEVRRALERLAGAGERDDADAIAEWLRSTSRPAPVDAAIGQAETLVASSE